MHDLSEAKDPIQRAEWARADLREAAQDLRVAIAAVKDSLSEDTLAELQIVLNNAESEASR